MKKNICLLVILLLLLFIIGCGNSSSNKPDDIRQDIYSECVKYYFLIDGKMDKNEVLSDVEHDEINKFAQKYVNDNLTDNERGILVGVLTMAKLNFENNLGVKSNNEEIKNKVKQEYEQVKKDLNKYGL